MLSPRWMKLVRDMRATKGRTALMVLAIAAGVCGVATMLTSYSILERETRRNYLATNPPSATLNVERIEPKLVEQVRRFPGIRQAQAVLLQPQHVHGAGGVEEWGADGSGGKGGMGKGVVYLIRDASNAETVPLTV